MLEKDEKFIQNFGRIASRFGDVDWRQLVQDDIQWQAVINVIMNLCVQCRAGNSLTS
jgi:hypothetical protein